MCSSDLRERRAWRHEDAVASEHVGFVVVSKPPIHGEGGGERSVRKMGVHARQLSLYVGRAFNAGGQGEATARKLMQRP